MFFESIHLKIDIEIFEIFDININCNLMTINICTKNKKIENRRRQIVVENHFIVHDFIY